jgi:hypothetical protein
MNRFMNDISVVLQKFNGKMIAARINAQYSG